MPMTGKAFPETENKPPATLPFPNRVSGGRPTTHFDLRVPRSDSDQMVGIDYFSPEEAYLACAEADQEILYGPDGSAFLFRIKPKAVATSSSVTFRA